MDTTLKTNEAFHPATEERPGVQSVRQAYDSPADGKPKPEWVRCPQCGDQIISNCYYVGGRGYLCIWERWASLGIEPICSYRKVL